MSVKVKNYFCSGKLSVGMKDSLANYLEMTFRVSVKELNICVKNTFNNIQYWYKT